MAYIRTEEGKIVETNEIPDHVEPCFCQECGQRIGWYDTNLSDLPAAWCDDCVPQEDDDE